MLHLVLNPKYARGGGLKAEEGGHHVFEPEQEYRRSELHEKYRGQPQGGISTPKDYPFIMLFTGETGADYGYRDHWDKGVFYYTGEGRVGDM